MQWIKMHVSPALRGSIRFDLTPAERGVWYDLLLMAGDGRTPGIICASKGIPYPHEWIADQLRIDIDLLKTTLDKCQTEGRINVNGNGIEIVNWKKYQDEYNRQKGYREAKKNVETAEDVRHKLANQKFGANRVKK